MVDLPEPLTPVTQHVDAGAGEFKMLAAWLAAVLWYWDGEAAGEILAGDGVGVGGDFGYGA
jgi:hypothetical protein